MKFIVNTDTVDIRNKQIGIHYLDCNNREFCGGVNHKGTKESVEKATEIARLFAAAQEMLEALNACEKALSAQALKAEIDRELFTRELVMVRQVIAKAEGK